VTLKIALIGDSHFDEHSRLSECERIHDWIAADAGSRGVQLTLHSGDLYERKSTPREREAVAVWVQAMAELGPVVIARGNHDALDDLPLLERLEVSNPVRVVERCETLRISTEGGDVALGVLGWPQRAHVAALAGDASKEGVEQVAADALRAVLRGLGDFLEQQTDCPAILLAHAMVRGSRVSTGQPLVGCDFELGLEDLALARASFYALGHVHMENVFDIAGAPAAYPGSPRRTAFGELEDKGWSAGNAW
jgi:DNA repair exonuclease SbcCD nuclease subunit